MAIEYYAHTRENPETGLIEYQTVEQHLRGTAELCAEFADKLNAKEYGELVGSLHDYGKCTREFLNRILNSGPRVDHSTAGAIICAKKDHVFLAACIAGHHSGLPDFGNMYADTAASHTLFGRIKKGISKKFVEKCGDSGVPMPDVKPYMEKNLLFASQWTRMMFSCETGMFPKQRTIKKVGANIMRQIPVQTQPEYGSPTIGESCAGCKTACIPQSRPSPLCAS